MDAGTGMFKDWISLNSNSLAWIALVVGGVLVTNFLLIPG